MTIRDLHNTASSNTVIFLAWGGCLKEFERYSPLDMDAYGRYSIASIVAADENRIECEIKMEPVKE